MRSRACLAFGYGVSGLAALILLLRECIAAFGGAELCIGLFLALWFLGAAIGLLLFRRAHRRAPILVDAPELLLMAWIPVQYMQYGLVVLLPGLAGGQSHAV